MDKPRFDAIVRHSQTQVRTLPVEQRDIARKAISTVNTPIYRAFVESKTNEFDKARKVHEQVRDECMYVLFLDKFYESGNPEFQKIADECHVRVQQTLNPAQREKLSDTEKRLFAFWDLEQKMKQSMQRNDPVSDADLREFIRRKSTDVFLYTTVTRFSSYIPKEVIMELYMHQLLRDLGDDHDDLEEDLSEGMPNPLLLRLVQKGVNVPTLPKDQAVLSREVDASGVSKEHTAFVTKYCRAIEPDLPEHLQWMRECAGIDVNMMLQKTS